mmetsp:Transcript_1923/g.2244  ORF Transcript_1923/g.2244 Transcript_1923/m.2244 type:complete len:409 (-) Transcript_1923:73-1299(-)
MTAITQASANREKKNNNLFVVGISITIIVSILLSVSYFLILSDQTNSHHIRSRTSNTNMPPTMNKAVTTIVTAVSPLVKQTYKLVKKTKLSPDSFLLRYRLPSERRYLGIIPSLPTCIKVDAPNPALAAAAAASTTSIVDESTLSASKKKILHSVLSKSYSPVSHPSQPHYFELVVKSYSTLWKDGGGVGKYLCDMEVGESITAELKSQRMMHGSSQLLHRGWTQIGLIAGGTGIAPLLQLARIFLEEFEGDDNDINESSKEHKHKQELLPKIHLLFINHTTQDILGRKEIEALRDKYPDNFAVTYLLTRQEEEKEQESTNNIQFFYGSRGDVDVAQKALPKPSSLSDTDTTDTMIFVCGRDGFVDHWAGPVTRGPPPPGKNKGPKIQGPLLGVLEAAGYDESQVFKY